MNNSYSLVKRLLLAGGLALGTLGTATLSGPTAGAQPPPGSPGIPALCPQNRCIAPPISPLTVQALGTEASLTFGTLEPATVTVYYKPVTMAAPTPASGQSPSQGYATAHERTLTGLKSNTTYDVTVTATTQGGQKHTAQTRFTTSKQRVRITLREIKIERDGDTIGDGEPSWNVYLQWAGGKAGACYPNNGVFCENPSRGDGRIFPHNYLGKPLMWLFAEENFDAMPDSFQLVVKADEYDVVDILSAYVEWIDGDFQRAVGSAGPVLTAPRDKEWSSQPVTIRADHHSTAGQDFKSVLTFTVETFHDNLSYPATRNRPKSTWSR